MYASQAVKNDLFLSDQEEGLPDFHFISVYSSRLRCLVIACIGAPLSINTEGAKEILIDLLTCSFTNIGHSPNSLFRPRAYFQNLKLESHKGIYIV